MFPRNLRKGESEEGGEEVWGEAGKGGVLCFRKVWMSTKNSCPLNLVLHSPPQKGPKIREKL